MTATIRHRYRRFWWHSTTASPDGRPGPWGPIQAVTRQEAEARAQAMAERTGMGFSHVEEIEGEDRP